MKANMRRHLPGPLAVRDIAQGSWRLSQQAAPALDVWVRAAGPDAAGAFRTTSWDALDIEWRGARAQLELRSRGQTIRLEADSVIVHEPLARLYAALPLASFDARARKFWRRVFTLVRIPGGRSLLKILARRRRG
jgi:hypothetical protein